MDNEGNDHNRGSFIKSLFGLGPKRKNKRTVPDAGTTILVVDDSKTIRTVLGKMLHESGYNVLEAEDGESAIELAHRHLPHLILMDVVMPGINGFQATRRLAKEPETAHIPIIIMSGNEEAIEQFWLVKIGARDFMAKPFNRFEVFRRVERILYNNEIL